MVHVKRSSVCTGTSREGRSSGERARLLREIGDHKFNELAEMALFWLFAEVAVNPRVIAAYVFPGSIPGFYTHLEYIKLVP
jgi:hypothetical protein